MEELRNLALDTVSLAGYESAPQRGWNRPAAGFVSSSGKSFPVTFLPGACAFFDAPSDQKNKHGAIGRDMEQLNALFAKYTGSIHPPRFTYALAQRSISR